MNLVIVVVCLLQLSVGVLGNDVKRFGPGNGFMCHCKDSAEQCNKQSGQCISGCATAWFGPGCQYRDLAQMENKVLSQTLDPRGTEARKAVDGDEKTCSKTRADHNPYWKIKLPQNETITELYIQTNQRPLRHFAHIRVFVEFNPKYESGISELCFSGKNGQPKNTSFKITCEAPMTGNQLRIELGQQNQQREKPRLVLCDIRINGGRNLAFDKPTSQSSILYHDDGYRSSKAVDRDVNTCSMTDSSKNQVWRLNLGHAAILQHIKLTTKSGRTQAYQVQLFDGSNSVVHTWEYQYSDPQHNVNEEATRITIQSKVSGSVSMCEVELFGDCTDNYCGFDCKTECHCNDMSIWDRMSVCSSVLRNDVHPEKECDDGYYGSPSCQRCGHCINKQVCDKVTGKCPNGCQAGYDGEFCSTVCIEGKYGQNCQYNCTGHCKHGSNYCNHVTGECHHGCTHGWHGKRCDSDVQQDKDCDDGYYGSPSCQRCGHCINNQVCDKVTGSCPYRCQAGYKRDLCSTVCEPGRYGNDCSSSCSKNCINNRCNHITGSCEGGCKDGWTGDKCIHKCIEGKYGQNCEYYCAGHCKGGNRNCNHVNGKCRYRCTQGWQGDRCDNECPVGSYGDQCKDKCSSHCTTKHYSRACSATDGSCLHGCKPGWRTDACDKECSIGSYGDGCKKTCSHCLYSKCNHITGICENGCKPGWRGNKCENLCEVGKYGQDCLHGCSRRCKNRNNCDHVTGVCNQGCTYGWQGERCDRGCGYNQYGKNCSKHCNTQCTRKHRTQTCSATDGSCLHGCTPGWRTSTCNEECIAGRYGQNCSNHCSQHCKGGQLKCHKTDGRCSSGCELGWKSPLCIEECREGRYGQNCQYYCSRNCKDGTICNYVTGKCHNGCKDGWHGDKCKKRCPAGTYGSKCKNTCSKNCKHNICRHTDGYCDHRCNDGWQGDQCTNVCPYPKYGHGCTKTCYRNCKDNKCNHIDGKCERGCNAGWQGEMCQYPCKDGTYGDQCLGSCSKHCTKFACNKVTGHCVGGCKEGLQGDTCEEECTDGTYGYQCKGSCSEHCKKYACNKVNGHCVEGCKDGWQGEMCENKCNFGTYGAQCKSHCNKNCVQGKCNHIDGTCELGCKDGWFGDMCEDECEAGKWGTGCGNKCGNCSDGTCDAKDGSCSDLCDIGFKHTSMCNEECDDGFYGINCSDTCGNCYNGSVCDKITGVCSDGCTTSYTGDLCIQVLAKQAFAGTIVPVGIGAGVFLIIGIVLIALFVFIGRRRKRSTVHRGDTATENKAGPSGVNVISPPAKDESNVEVPRVKTSVRLSELFQYVRRSISNRDKLISEFQTIPYGLQYSTERASLPDNVGKNRYKEIYPYESSRVILSTLRGIPNSDYINASYIRGHTREHAYIAAQGPINTSLEDFWRMIWEKDVRTIAMLTNLTEEMKVKCVQYWGDPSSEMTYGNLTVTNESEHIFAEFTIRRFKVCPKSDRGNERTVTHYHFTAWPDKGVPRSTSSLVQFLHVVRQTDSCKSHTWLVHCSAGVGRTGTFIAMDILYDEGEDLGTVDIYRCVQALREQRVNMVQTKEQYKFLHGLVLELLVLPSKQIHLDAVSAFYASLLSVDSLTGKTRLLMEYEDLQNETSLMNLLYENCKLQSSTDDEDRFAAAKLDANKTRNRYQNVLAANEFRPFLATKVPGCTNYINAVYIQSYCNKKGFILSQTPMKGTAVDCCRLLIEEGIKVIVTFEYKAKDKEDVGEYLPDNGSIQLGPFKCTKLAETDENSYLVRTHRIVYGTEETTVYQLIFKNWPTKLIVPPSPSAILNFLHVVEFTNRRETGNAVLVQCLNGAERSGLFVVLMNIMEHIRYESRVSIPHLVRCARIRREQIIPNFEQYKFCHDVVSSYVENNSTYANM